MSAARPDPREDRHAAAVARSLQWADEAAERADWAGAIAWVDVVEACGDELPDDFRTRREVWLRALGNPSTP